VPRSRRIPPIALGRQAPQSDYLRDQLGTARISPDVQITRLDATGAGVQLITGASATITANQAVTELTITLAHVLAGEAVTINGLTFTAHSTTTTPANREFDISGADTKADPGRSMAPTPDNAPPLKRSQSRASPRMTSSAARSRPPT
jgi:hypothetical protein